MTLSAPATAQAGMFNDSVVESSETVIVTLSAGAGCTAGTPASATVTVASDDSAGGGGEIGEIIVDNGQPGTSFSGSWTVSSAPSSYGSNSLFASGAAPDAYRWTPTIPSTGNYLVNVYVWWTAHANRSTAVPRRPRAR